jgi:hypothetical protein
MNHTVMGRCIKIAEVLTAVSEYLKQTTQQFSKVNYKVTPKCWLMRCEKSENRIVLELANNKNARTIRIFG